MILVGSIVLSDAYACTCAVPIDHDAANKDAEFSYIGTVMSVEVKDGWQSVIFDVHQKIKGDIYNPHILYEKSLSSATCGMNYELGHTYIVHENNWSEEKELFSDEPNTILPRTNSCDTEDMLNNGSFTINDEHGYLDLTTSTDSLNPFYLFIMVIIAGGIAFYYWRKKKQ